MLEPICPAAVVQTGEPPASRIDSIAAEIPSGFVTLILHGSPATSSAGVVTDSEFALTKETVAAAVDVPVAAETTVSYTHLTLPTNREV